MMLAFLLAVPVRAECIHEFVEMRQEPTCEEGGLAWLQCILCGFGTGYDTLAPLGHSFGEWYTVTEPGEYTDGEERRDCSVCGHYETRVIPALGHSWSGWSITDVTCTASGSRTRTCSVCRESETETIPATGHKWNAGVITQEPTASADGVKTYTCTVCGDTRTEAVKYQSELKAPSVSMTLSTSSTGKIVMTAQVDDYENLDDYYEITSHGVLYVQASRIGSRTLTVNTSGRTRVTFTGYNDDGTFIYNLKPSSKSTVYALRAFITYKNTKTGATVTAYSDMFRTSYNGIKG